MLNRKERTLGPFLVEYIRHARYFASFFTPQHLEQDIGTIPGCISFLQLSAQHSDLCKGKELHSWMLKHNFLASALSVTSLIKMYSKCNHISYALSVFLQSREIYNVFIYNAILASCFSNNLYEEIFKLYKQMRQHSVDPDKFTFPSVIKGCLDVLQVKMIHSSLFKFGFEFDFYIGSALVNSYLKFGSMDEASCVFDELPLRDVALWNDFINGFVQIKEFDKALIIFRRMNEEGTALDDLTATAVLSALSMSGNFDDGHAMHGYVIKKGLGFGLEVSNALIDMYVKCARMMYAYKVFDKMKVRDVASWNIMIMGYGLHGQFTEALAMFETMCLDEIAPNEVTFTGVLRACSHGGFLSRGHEYFLKMESVYGVVPCSEHYACVVDMLGRAGELKKAYELLLAVHIENNVVVWRAFLAACMTHGNCDLAEVAAKHIDELDPDS